MSVCEHFWQRKQREDGLIRSQRLQSAEFLSGTGLVKCEWKIDLVSEEIVEELLNGLKDTLSEMQRFKVTSSM